MTAAEQLAAEAAPTCAMAPRSNSLSTELFTILYRLLTCLADEHIDSPVQFLNILMYAPPIVAFSLMATACAQLDPRSLGKARCGLFTMRQASHRGKPVNDALRRLIEK